MGKNTPALVHPQSQSHSHRNAIYTGIWEWDSSGIRLYHLGSHKPLGHSPEQTARALERLWKGREGSGLAPNTSSTLLHLAARPSWKYLPGFPIGSTLCVPAEEPFPGGKEQQRSCSEGSWAIPSLFPAIRSLPGALAAVPDTEPTGAITPTTPVPMPAELPLAFPHGTIIASHRAVTTRLSHYSILRFHLFYKISPKLGIAQQTSEL